MVEVGELRGAFGRLLSEPQWFSGERRGNLVEPKESLCSVLGMGMALRQAEAGAVERAGHAGDAHLSLLGQFALFCGISSY